MNKPEYLTIKQAVTDKADIYIDGEIVTDEWMDSDTSASGFRDSLKEIGEVSEINLHINSPGGSVFEGIAIFNMLKNSKAKINVYIDGLAASIASVIAMAGDKIYMPSNAMLMIHNPWVLCQGNADELRKQADDLDKIGKLSVQTYVDRSNGKTSAEEIQSLMNEEAWLTAQEAVDLGLADEVMESNRMAASINVNDAKRYHNVPEQIIDKKARNNDVISESLKTAKEHAESMKIKLENLEENINGII